MLQSVREERSRHFKLALRIGIPVLLFVFLLAYVVFFREERIEWNTETVAILLAMIFVIVYFIYFALELSRKETLLDRVTDGYHYDSFLQRIAAGKPRTLAAIKIDNLATINENYGVARADSILRNLVEILHTTLLAELDQNGSIGRKTGAELLLALDREPEEVEKTLRGFCQTHQQIDGVEVHLVFAVIRNNILDPSKTLEQLRDLLVKHSYAEPEETREKIPDARLLSEEEQQVLQVLEQGGIQLSFRPLLNLHTGKRDIYEIAVKMVTEEGQTIPPRNFLPIVNRHNLGIEYDLLIFKRLLAVAPLIDEKISFTFNLSPFSLRREEFITELFSLAEQSHVSSRRFIIELYERRRHHRLEEYLQDLKRVKSHGFRLCLDNFGSSNASMEYLRHFPFDMIQIDREYTKGLEEKKSLSVFKSFISMAHEMGMITAAKWVDEAQTIDKLRELGIDYIQGYASGPIYTEEKFIRVYNPIKE